MGKFTILFAVSILWSSLLGAQVLTNPDAPTPVGSGADGTPAVDTNFTNSALAGLTDPNVPTIGAGNAARCFTKSGLEVVIVIPTALIQTCKLNTHPEIAKLEKDFLKNHQKDEEKIIASRKAYYTQLQNDAPCYFGTEPVFKLNGYLKNLYWARYNVGMGIQAGDYSDEFAAFDALDTADGTNCKKLLKEKLDALDDRGKAGCPVPAQGSFDCGNAGWSDGVAAYNRVKQYNAQAPAPPPPPPPAAPAAPAAPVAPAPPHVDYNPVDPSCDVTEFDGTLPSAAAKTANWCATVLAPCLKTNLFAKTCDTTNPDCTTFIKTGPEFIIGPTANIYQAGKLTNGCQVSYKRFCGDKNDPNSTGVDAGACDVTAQFTGDRPTVQPVAPPAATVPSDVAATITTAQNALNNFSKAVELAYPGKSDKIMKCGIKTFETTRACDISDDSFYNLQLWMKNPSNSGAGTKNAAFLATEFNTKLNDSDAMAQFFSKNGLDTSNPKLTGPFQDVQSAMQGLASTSFFRMVAAGTGSSAPSSGGFSDLSRFDAFPKIDSYGRSNLSCLMVPNPPPPVGSQLRADYLNNIVQDNRRMNNIARALKTCTIKWGYNSSGTSIQDRSPRTTH